ncbi:MAG: hypothetical protein HY324_03870 [Chlamydiia bacterium]|nr:hypothetical protein [Chlamydiia bacterium]
MNRGVFLLRWVFAFSPALLFSSITSDLSIGLQALQQMRVLIPERLSVQEFSVHVDQRSLIDSLVRIQPPSVNDLILRGIGASRYYYLRWTISGNPVRILDSYLEFEQGPYWLYPTAMQKLWEMEHPTKKTQ